MSEGYIGEECLLHEKFLSMPTNFKDALSIKQKDMQTM